MQLKISSIYFTLKLPVDQLPAKTVSCGRTSVAVWKFLQTLAMLPVAAVAGLVS
jgi:hypothetical protein